MTVDASSIAPDQMSVKNMQRTRTSSLATALYLSIFIFLMFFMIVNLSCWEAYRSHVIKTSRSPSVILNLTSLLMKNYYMATDSLMAFADCTSLVEANRRGLLTDGHLAAMRKMVIHNVSTRRLMQVRTEAYEDLAEVFEIVEARYEDISHEGLASAAELQEMLIKELLEIGSKELVGKKFTINFNADASQSFLSEDFKSLFGVNEFTAIQLLSLVYNTMDNGIAITRQLFHQDEELNNSSIVMQRFEMMNYMLINHAYSDLLNPMVSQIGDGLNDLLDKSTKGHDAYTNTVTGILVGLTAFALLLLTGFLIGYQRRISNILAAYCCLSESDINFEIDLLSSANSILSSNKIFSERRVNDASELMAADCLKTKTAAGKSKVKARMIRSRYGLKTTDGADGLKTTLPYKSIAWTSVFAFLLISAVVCSIISIRSARNTMMAMYDISKASVDNDMIIISCQSRLVEKIMFAPFSTTVMNLTEKIKNMPFVNPKAVEKFTNFWYTSRKNLEQQSDNQLDFNEFLYGDLCALIFNYPDQPEDEKANRLRVCSQSSYHFGNKGFNQFLIYEDRLIGEVKELEDVVLKSIRDNPEMNENDRMILLMGAWYDAKYISLRSSHHEILEFYFDYTFKLFDDTLSAKILTINKAIDTSTIVIWLLSAILSLILFFQTSRLLLEDNAVALYCFDIMHPSVIINNQYIKAKFKIYFNFYTTV